MYEKGIAFLKYNFEKANFIKPFKTAGFSIFYSVIILYILPVDFVSRLFF